MVPAFRKGPSRRSTEEIQERRVVVAQLHREGRTAQEIATFVGMGVSTIELDLQSMGIQPTGKRTYTKLTISVKDEVQRRLRMLHVRAYPVAGRHARLRWFGQPACFLFPLRTVQ